jgi:hypothetical protein
VPRNAGKPASAQDDNSLEAGRQEIGRALTWSGSIRGLSAVGIAGTLLVEQNDERPCVVLAELALVGGLSFSLAHAHTLGRGG